MIQGAFRRASDFSVLSAAFRRQIARQARIARFLFIESTSDRLRTVSPSPRRHPRQRHGGFLPARLQSQRFVFHVVMATCPAPQRAMRPANFCFPTT